MSDLKKIQYKEFCEAQTDLPLFVQPWYLDAVVGPNGWNVALVERQKKVIASLPYVYSQQGRFKGLAHPPLIPRMGPFLIQEFRAYERQHKYLFHLIGQLPDFSYFRQDFHPGITNWLPFYWNGFQQTTHYSYQVDLTRSMEAIYNSMSPDYRLNKISNARRYVRTVFNRTIHDFYTLYTADRRSKNLQVIPFDQLERLYTALSEHKTCKLFSTVDGLHQLQSACLLVWDQHAAYVLLHTLNPDTSYPDAIIVALWETMHYSRNTLKLPVFDLLSGMNKEDEQLYRGFGTLQVPYFSIKKVNSRWLRLQQAWKNS